MLLIVHQDFTSFLVKEFDYDIIDKWNNNELHIFDVSIADKPKEYSYDNSRLSVEPHNWDDIEEI